MFEIVESIFLDSIGVAAVLSFVYFVFRKSVDNYFTKMIGMKFEKQLEHEKSELREREKQIELRFGAKEKELERISNFLSHMKMDQGSVVTRRKIEAAETVMNACMELNRLSMAVETLKLLDMPKIFERYDDPNIQSIFKFYDNTLKIDSVLEDYRSHKVEIAKLYLSDKANLHFEAYSSIMTCAAAHIKVLSIGVNPHDLLNTEDLRNKVVGVASNSKDAFEKYGDGHAFFWVDYVYSQTINALRSTANGFDQDEVNEITATNLSINSNRAYENAKMTFVQAGFPKDVLAEVSQAPDLPSE